MKKLDFFFIYLTLCGGGVVLLNMQIYACINRRNLICINDCQWKKTCKNISNPLNIIIINNNNNDETVQIAARPLETETRHRKWRHVRRIVCCSVSSWCVRSVHSTGRVLGYLRQCEVHWGRECGGVWERAGGDDDAELAPGLTVTTEPPFLLHRSETE